MESLDVKQLLAMRRELKKALEEADEDSRRRSKCPFRNEREIGSPSVTSKRRPSGSDSCLATSTCNRQPNCSSRDTTASSEKDRRGSYESKFVNGKCPRSRSSPLRTGRDHSAVPTGNPASCNSISKFNGVSKVRRRVENGRVRRTSKRASSLDDADRPPTVPPKIPKCNFSPTLKEETSQKVINGDVALCKPFVEVEALVNEYPKENGVSSLSEIVEAVAHPDLKDSEDGELRLNVAESTEKDSVDMSCDETISDLYLPPPPPPPIIVDETLTAVLINESSPRSHVSDECLTETRTDQIEADKDAMDDTFISDEEDGVDSLLEKPYEGGQNGKMPIPDEGEIRDKIVLAHRGTDYFDVLPEGWVEVTHTCGLPIYLHKSSRVCTFSRPYFIGPGSVRHHSVPESAVPCLHQTRVLREVEERAKASAAALENALNNAVDGSTDLGQATEENTKLALARLQAPGTKVQTSEDFKERQLDPQALHEYAKRIFRFKTIQVYRFNKWTTTRSFHRQKKMAEAERFGKLTPSIEVPTGRPTLPSNVKLITVPAMETNLKPQHKGFFLNPQGKTSVSVLHEYVQKVLKSAIVYHFTETRSSSTPYECSARLKMNLNNRVMTAASIKEKLMLLQEKQKREQQIQENGDQAESDVVVLGTGYGNSKKTAKLDAARSALKVLIPAIDFDSEGIAVNQKEGEDVEGEQEDAVALFDMLPIEDSRIPDLSARAGQPSPYLLLQECLKRNAAYGDTEIKLNSSRVKHQKHQFDMDVGKHRVSVVCSNKREGKQKASQAMLKKLHPNLDTWGSLIRLYGHEAQQKQQEARRSRQSIIKLQGTRDKEGSSMEPNMAILEKLRAEMRNVLHAKRRRMAAGNSVVIGDEISKSRPELSHTNDLLDGDSAENLSGQHASSHPDALSVLRIDL